MALESSCGTQTSVAHRSRMVPAEKERRRVGDVLCSERPRWRLQRGWRERVWDSILREGGREVMDKLSVRLCLVAVMLLLLSSSSSAQTTDEGKAYYTDEEIRALCGVPVDLDEMAEVAARHDRMLAEYKRSRGDRGVSKAAAVPGWQGMMSPIENQGCGNCWAHAATGVTEGFIQLQKGLPRYRGSLLPRNWDFNRWRRTGSPLKEGVK